MIKVNLSKPTPADLEAVRVALVGFQKTLEQFAPVILRAVGEAGAHAAACLRAFRPVLIENMAKEERRRAAK